MPASPEELSERDGPGEGNPSGGDRERWGFDRECDWNVDPSDLAEVRARRLTPHTRRDGPARPDKIKNRAIDQLTAIGYIVSLIPRPLTGPQRQ